MLDPFPFSEQEWALVCDASTEVVNATLMDDTVLRASKLVDLQVVLESLREVHGNHPVLIETEADFAQDPHERRELYLQAIDAAVEGVIPTYTIRISLADSLLECFADARTAQAELGACEVEVNELGDEWYQGQWRDLMKQCRHFEQKGAKIGENIS